MDMDIDMDIEDKRIIDLLFARSENALDELSCKYSRLYRNILRQLLGNESDAEECANDVLLAVWNSIPPNRPDNLPAYLCKIARRIGINRARYRTRQKRNADYTVLLSELDDCIPDRDSPDGQETEGETIRAVLSDFLRGLDKETRVLFVRRYIYLETVASLAERFGLSENHVSVKLFRARKKLKKLLEKEEIFI